MMNLGERMSEVECDALVDVRYLDIETESLVIFSQEADIDGDGCINYEEFYNMMTSGGRYCKSDCSFVA